LECAREERRITADPCTTLVLLVGFSLEPLLQSVCVYQPGEVVLVLNQEGYPPEEWQDFARHIIEAIGYLLEKGLVSQPPQFAGENDNGFSTASQPQAVFQTLMETLRDKTDVVIDVTGGKKSMVSGAYMYAAYAGVRISYVDFEEYAPKHRRPYGYSCKIGELANPYQTFALREWERVRDLYEERYQFREAHRVLKNEVLPAMKNALPESEESIKTSAEFLRYYELWDSGDFRGAKQKAQDLEQQVGAFEQPSAVTTLGDQWFETSSNNFANKPRHFYGNSDALKVYVIDELARIRRLIEYNEDYRSAFLRAGGLNEIVMLARVVRLVSNCQERNNLLDALDGDTPGIYSVFENLRKPAGTDLTISKDKYERVKFGQRKTVLVTISLPSPMNAWWQNTDLFNGSDGWKQFLTKRNELAHKYFSVPREWAEDALRFAQANFADFLGHPISNLGLQTTALSWPRLCDLCSVSRFLPPSLRKEVQP